MAEARPIILYVGGSQGPDCQLWEDCLTQAGLEIKRVDDVYLALALLGRGKVTPSAVIVCVDFLDASEFEFFGLVSRHHRRTAIYVCGCAEAADKLEAAMRAGAYGVLTAANWEKLIQELRGKVEGAAENPTDPADQTAEKPAESTPSPEVRVPWRKSSGEPVRTPPNRGECPTTRGKHEEEDRD